MGTEIDTIRASLRDEARAYAQAEPVKGGSRFSLKGGILTLRQDGEDYEMPGNQVAAVIIDHVMLNTYYGRKYTDADKAPPICFAVARRNEHMFPHAATLEHEFFQPQSDDCSTCPQNQFGTSQTGRGKACRNGRRLGLLIAGEYTPIKGSGGFDLDLFDDEDHFQATDMVEMTLPVMSTIEYGAYVKKLADTVQLPPWAVITRLHLVPSKASQFLVKFEMLEVVPDHLLPILKRRNETAGDRLLEPFSPPRDDDEDDPPALKKGGLKGLRK